MPDKLHHTFKYMCANEVTVQKTIKSKFRINEEQHLQTHHKWLNVNKGIKNLEQSH